MIDGRRNHPTLDAGHSIDADSSRTRHGRAPGQDGTRPERSSRPQSVHRSTPQPPARVPARGRSGRPRSDGLNSARVSRSETKRRHLHRWKMPSDLGGRYWDRTSDLFGVNEVKALPGHGCLAICPGHSAGQRWSRGAFRGTFCKIVSQISPNVMVLALLLLVAGFPVAQVSPGRAASAGSEWSTSLERPGPGRRGLVASGAPSASRPRAFPERRGPGRVALAAGGRIRVVGPEALPSRRHCPCRARPGSRRLARPPNRPWLGGMGVGKERTVAIGDVLGVLA